eukprot:m.172126 g.172126  ORF g.172126 m.172126 type:complete len:404 (-) comp17854_c0_seq2:395-1606(-)
MGRRKINIEHIDDDRNRQTTLKKRKEGLMKKAYELSVLCGCEIAMIIFDSNGKHYQYGSHKINETLMRLAKAGPPTENHTNESLAERIEQKETRLKAAKSGEAPVERPQPVAPVVAAEPVLRKTLEFTPRTMTRLNQLDREFATMMEHMRNEASAQGGDKEKTQDAATTFTAPSLRPAVGGDGAGAAAAAARDTRLSQRKPPGLEVMIPARTVGGPPAAAGGVAAAKAQQPVQQAFPAGTRPKPNANGTATVFSPTAGTILPTPSFTGNLPPGLLQYQSTSPWPITPTTLNASINWQTQSPAVLHTGAAGDLHVSNSFQQAQQQAHQQQAVAQMQAVQLMQREANAAAALAKVSNDRMEDTSSSDDDDDEQDETRSGSKRKARRMVADSPPAAPKQSRTGHDA